MVDVEAEQVSTPRSIPTYIMYLTSGGGTLLKCATTIYIILEAEFFYVSLYKAFRKELGIGFQAEK